MARKTLFGIEVEIGTALPGQSPLRMYHFATVKDREEFECLLERRPELGKRTRLRSTSSTTVADALLDLEQNLSQSVRRSLAARTSAN
jgi:hypothetical protein